MTQRVYIVSQDNVVGLVPALQRWFDVMAAWTRGRFTAADIIKRVLGMEYTLWVVLDKEGTAQGALVTRVEQYPRMKMLHVLHCAGDVGSLESASAEVMTALDSMAQFNNCAGVEFIGRPGWEHTAKRHGYEVRSVMRQKFFEGAQHE